VTRYLIEKDGERQNVTSLEGYEGWTVVSEGVPQFAIEALRADKWDAVKTHRDQLRYGGCLTPKGQMQTDPESQRRLNSTLLRAQIAGKPFTINWTMSDNRVIPFTRSDIEAAVTAIGEFDARCQAVSQTLRAQIELCTTAEQLDAIDIEGAGWPHQS
jgi:hypothetical protein